MRPQQRITADQPCIHALLAHLTDQQPRLGVGGGADDRRERRLPSDAFLDGPRDQGAVRLDGLELCRRLRQEAKKSTPVLMLTARDTLADKVTGLDAGADDYLVKPFAIQELEARVRALIRRERRQVSAEVLRIADLVLDTASLRVTRAGQELQLSPIGLRLLTILMRESPRVVTRRDIEREIWGDGLPDSDTLRSHLYNLRKAIDRPFDKPLLHTVQTAGYRIADLDHVPA